MADTLQSLMQAIDLPPIIQLFQVTLGTQTYRVTNTMFEGQLYWDGQIYTSFPVSLSNIGYTEDNASDKPRLTLSNVGGHFDMVFPAIPNLKGAVVEYVLTFESYTGESLGTETNLAITRHKYKVAKLTSKTETQIVYELDGLLGFAGVKMPRRQMLRDGNTKLRFAGLGYNKTTTG